MPGFIVCVVSIVAGFALGVMSSNEVAGLRMCELELPRNQHCVLVAVPEKPTP